MSALLAGAGGALANALLVLALAPLAQGLVRKLTARVQSRRGPPLVQPWFDLLKLLGKEDLEAGEVPAVQRLAPALALASVLGAAALVPMGFPAPLGGAGDALLLAYLLTLSGLSTVLAGAAAGSTYALLGAGREVVALVSLEPLLAVALAAGALAAGSLRVEALAHGAVFAPAVPCSGFLLLAVTLLALQGFVARAPFDVAEAETELMDGPLAEYSGRKLALLQYARMAKLVVYPALLVALFSPLGPGLPWPLAVLAFWAQVLALVVLVTLVAATHARRRVDQALRFYAGLFAAALAALALASVGI